MVRGAQKITGPAGTIEALLRAVNSPPAAAVVAHPHPLHGGTMHNSVVFHAERALHRLGLATLRFNFRGVGASAGAHDSGRGELEDLAACAGWLRERYPEAPLLLAGYSFGSWCALRLAARDPSIVGVIAIGLPVRVYGWEEIDSLRCSLAVIQGAEDEFGSPGEVRELLLRAPLSSTLRVVEGAPHLFPGRAAEVATHVRDAAAELLERVGIGGGV